MKSKLLWSSSMMELYPDKVLQLAANIWSGKFPVLRHVKVQEYSRTQRVVRFRPLLDCRGRFEKYQLTPDGKFRFFPPYFHTRGEIPASTRVAAVKRIRMSREGPETIRTPGSCKERAYARKSHTYFSLNHFVCIRCPGGGCLTETKRFSQILIKERWATQ